MTDRWAATRAADDTVAVDYAELIRVEQIVAVVDLAMLEEFASRVRGRGHVLDIESDSLAGVLAWYSIIHTPPQDLSGVLAELLRVLQPGGWLLTGHRSGVGDRHLHQAYGPISI